MGRECERCIDNWFHLYKSIRGLREAYKEMTEKGEVAWKMLEDDLRDYRDVDWKFVKTACEIPDDKAHRIESLFEEAIESARRKDTWSLYASLIDLEDSISVLDVDVAKKCQREKE